MSMTREEAAHILEYSRIVSENFTQEAVTATYVMALAALRGPTREQVVLCKECRFWQGNNGGYTHPECRWGHDEIPDEDDYCSFAERLEVSENG